MTHTPPTRFSLIGRLHDATDSEAWSEFVQIYQPMIQRIVQKRGLQYADAAEVTQEVLGRVASVINTWDPDPDKGSFRGWLYRMTRNLTIDHLRRKQQQPAIKNSDTNFDIGQVAEPTEDESREFQLEYERQLFNWAAGKVQSTFQPQNWQAFWLTTIENVSIDEVARRLGIPKGKIYVARSRVMAKIAAVIQERVQEKSHPQSQFPGGTN